MSRPFARLTAGFLFVCAVVAANAAAPASGTPSAAEAEQKAAFAAARAAQQAGPADVAVRDQAHLKLPGGYIWVPTPAASQLMRSMGNRVDDSFLGAIFPANDGDWFATVRFVKEGYIKDDDARDWNADDLLKNLREGTEAANEERVKRGIPAMDVVGWAQKPNYDAATHRLVWSALTRDKNATGNRDARWVINIAAAWDNPADDAMNVEWARSTWADMRRFSTGGTYVNFLNAEEGDDRTKAAYGANLDRLAAIKAAWDPDNVFRTNKNIAPRA